MLDKATSLRLRALARERTPAALQAEREKIEAGYAAEAAIRKAQSVANVPKWNAARKALGSGK
jgi:hypothetical protein